MTGYNLVKYNIKGSVKSIIIYYFILIVSITSLAILITSSGDNGSTSGLEFSSVVFLFVVGLNSFRENFYFAQANNISRVNYFKAAAIAILPISLTMAVFDIILNRVHNVFAVNPTMYDMAYNKDSSWYIEGWIQSNSIGTLFGTVTFLFAFYIAAFAIGLLITMIYYKCNKVMKIVVSLSPVAVIAILGSVSGNNPEFGQKLGVFIDSIFGISTKNSYTAVITFICLFLVSMFFVYILVRKAVVKRF